jgi:NAD(P)-dependent dehydrogenase (short-subunit alcohol dehydrogenase family)
MPANFAPGQWAVILGGSSGFGLATAQVLADHGMNLCIVHRDRRSQLAQIEPAFEKLRGSGVTVQTHNTDALAAAKRSAVLDALAEVMGGGRVRVLLHSIAFGNLKPLAPPPTRTARDATQKLAAKLGLEGGSVQEAVDELFSAGAAVAHPLATSPHYSEKDLLDDEDFSRTIFNMGTSLLGWTRDLFERKLLAADARIFGLTSEGNRVAWRGYAAVAAAKVALESLARSIAVEYAPHGVRCNVIQPGITETPALAAIPGSDQMKAQAQMRNPFHRLTTPIDVANAIYLLSLDEAAWVRRRAQLGSIAMTAGGIEAPDAVRVALVTGGGTGIGAACCRALAAEGFRVGIHYRSSEETALKLAAELKDSFAVCADLGSETDIDALIKDLKEKAGRVDVLVNNAGYNVNAPMLSMKLDDYDAVAGMARGTWYLTKLVLRRFMLRKGSGRIINVSSVVGHTGNPGQIPYTMIKAGLDAFSKSLAQELAGRDILVNSVAPGFIDTDMTRELPEETRDSILARIPQGRMGRDDEIADVVAFLATRASYINGSVIHVNGGMFGG